MSTYPAKADAVRALIRSLISKVQSVLPRTPSVSLRSPPRPELLSLQAFLPRLLGRCRVTAYVTGNVDTAAAAGLARHVQSLLSEQLKTQPPFASQVGQHDALGDLPHVD